MGILRFILAITVVMAHSSAIFGINSVGGQIAVQAFFIISGFYMTLILNEKYIGVNNSYKLFITNRLLRIYPIYWVILLLTILYSVILIISSDYKNFGSFLFFVENWKSINVLSLLYFVFINLFVFFQETVMFLGLNLKTGYLFFSSNLGSTVPQLYNFLLIPQGWSIGIELVFYVIAPFIVKRKLKSIILLILISITIRMVLYFLGLKEDPWKFRFFPSELVFFLLGTVSYHMYKKISILKIKNIYLYTIWFGIIGFTVLFSFLPLAQSLKHILYLVAFFICLPFVFMLTKNFKNDAKIGELSYPIYITHILVIAILTDLKMNILGEFGLKVVVVSILFSIILNHFVADKIEQIRKKRLATTP